MAEGFLQRCRYCISKDVREGKLSEGVEYEDPEKLDDYPPAFPVYDNHNIFVFYSCENCDKEQRSKYDPVIFNDWKKYEEKVTESGERVESE